MFLCAGNLKNYPVQAEFCHPLSKVKPLIVKGSEEQKTAVFISNAKDIAENQSMIAKEREVAKKVKMEEFQNKIKQNAQKIEKENKESRYQSQIQKINEKTRFLNVSKEYAERSVNIFKKKRLEEEEKTKKPIENIIVEEISVPKAEIIYPKMEEDMEEIDESSLKSVDETIKEYVSLREKLRSFNLLDNQSKLIIN